MPGGLQALGDDGHAGLRLAPARGVGSVGDERDVPRLGVIERIDARDRHVATADKSSAETFGQDRG